MSPEKKKRVALGNEPAVEPATGTDITQPWRSRQTEVDFLDWLAEWRGALGAHNFASEKVRWFQHPGISLFQILPGRVADGEHQQPTETTKIKEPWKYHRVRAEGHILYSQS